MHPKQLEIKNFTYVLPEERIARFPMPERDLSRLLVYKNGAIIESIYRDIDAFIPENSLLVFNNTKVIQARLLFQNSTGARIEIFCLEPAEENAEMASVMSRQGNVRWKCLVGRAAKWKEKVLQHQSTNFTLSAEIIDRSNDTFIIEFNWQPRQLTFAEILDKTGMMPIPPYLKRESAEVDESRYQTVYAKYKGSVAAPTAGLHFTETIFQKLKAKNVLVEEITLHVGAGTFKPVKSETMSGHEMHAELIDVTRQTIEHLLKSLEQNIIAVGTTSLRTTESLYWMGVKAAVNPESSLPDLEIKQWDAYELSDSYSAREALTALLNWMNQKGVKRIICKTQILIAPPYSLKIVKGLVTNFHQPNSTLLLLVASVIGEKWRDIYGYAMENDFRFLSYGDGSLLFKE
ncbi:MAG: S-adenosylmethionine:tRNA ribosyltransferase-isomerase [Chitinophagales bacterium]